MARTMTAAAEAALDESHVITVLLAELEFPSGTVRFNSSDVLVEWDGNQYLGAASCSGIEPIAESVQPQAAALNVRFSGLSSAFVDAILDDHYQGEPARIYVALWDRDDATLIDDPVLVFSGRMDEPVVEVGANATLQLALENEMADWSRPRLRRYSHADQTAVYAGDLFFEWTEELQSKELVWGIYKGPAAPDPLKVLNRTIDRALSWAPFGPLKPVVNAARNVGDRIARVFGW